MSLRILAAFALALQLLGAGTDPVPFRVDTTHTILGFKASTLLLDVPGRFTKYKLQLTGNPTAPEKAQIRLDIETASVDTSNKQRDDHLRSADFFDVAKYPVISFTSNQIRKDGDKLIVRGTLEMHGKSQMVELPFQAAEGLNGAGKATWSYRATVPLNRLAFGVGAESLAAKLSLKNDVELDLLLVGFFEPAKAPVP